MKKLFLALTLSILTTANVFAQASFVSIDTDQNGGITMAEAKAAGFNWTDQQFSSADTDQNGELNEDEFAAALQ